MVIDATGDDTPPNGPIPLPADMRALAPAAIAWRLVGNAMLVVQVKRGADGRGTVQALVKSRLLAAIKIIAVVSEDIDIRDDTSLIWGIFTRFDPATDTIFTEMRMDGAVPVYEGIMGIDASMKNGYPEPLVMSDEIVEKVTRRWDEYWR